MNWLKKHSVVVPIDFSEASFEALGPASAFVEDLANLHILHVLPPLSPVDPAARWHTLTDKSREAHVHEALDEKLAELGYGGVQIDVKVGNPSSEILEYAKAQGADLIVMPTHDDRGFSHFLFGSVTEQVTRHAPCPVLVIR